MCLIQKFVCIVSGIIVLCAILYHSMNTEESLLKFKDVGPFYSFGPENIGMYLMSEKRINQGLDPYYASKLNPNYYGTAMDPNINVPLLAANGVRSLETFTGSNTRNIGKPTATHTTRANIPYTTRANIPHTTRANIPHTTHSERPHPTPTGRLRNGL